MTNSPTITISPYASATVTQLDRVLHADQRGGGREINGKPSYSIQQAADEITRDNLRWPDLNGDGKTDIAYRFLTTAGQSFRQLGLTQFSEFNQAQKESALRAMEHWSDVANLSFTQASPGTQEDGNISFGNFALDPQGRNAFASLPPSEGARQFMASRPRAQINVPVAEVWLNGTEDAHTAPSLNNEGHKTLAHEVGHALGLGHPFRSHPAGVSYNTATYAEDTGGHSIMSYWSEHHSGQSFHKNGMHHSPSTPMVDDIAAMQKLYGVNHQTRTGDTTYGFNSNADREAYHLHSNADAPVFTVWDGGGTDTLDFSGFSQNQVINLNEGTPSDIGGMRKNVFIAKGTTIENAKGGAGDDILIGNAAQNELSGGGGKNTYVFLTPEQSTPQAPDRITDFVSGRDKIDISNLRATGLESTYIDESNYSPIEELRNGLNSTRPRRDIAQKPVELVSKFSGEGRQVMLTYDENARQEVLQIDLDGDRRADFMLKIDSEQMLSWGDFVK